MNARRINVVGLAGFIGLLFLLQGGACQNKAPSNAAVTAHIITPDLTVTATNADGSTTIDGDVLRIKTTGVDGTEQHVYAINKAGTITKLSGQDSEKFERALLETKKLSERQELFDRLVASGRMYYPEDKLADRIEFKLVRSSDENKIPKVPIRLEDVYRAGGVLGKLETTHFVVKFADGTEAITLDKGTCLRSSDKTAVECRYENSGFEALETVVKDMARQEKTRVFLLKAKSDVAQDLTASFSTLSSGASEKMEVVSPSATDNFATMPVSTYIVKSANATQASSFNAPGGVTIASDDGKKYDYSLKLQKELLSGKRWVKAYVYHERLVPDTEQHAFLTEAGDSTPPDFIKELGSDRIVRHVLLRYSKDIAVRGVPTIRYKMADNAFEIPVSVNVKVEEVYGTKLTQLDTAAGTCDPEIDHSQATLVDSQKSATVIATSPGGVCTAVIWD